jgi:hypothetical protein
MESVFADLRRLGVRPLRPGGETVVMDFGENLENKIIRLAWQIMRKEEWVKEPKAPPPIPGSLPPLEPLAEGVVSELILDETTEPRFVLIEEKDEPE